MTQKYMIDTSVWIEYFKQNKRVTDFIDSCLDSDSIYITGPVLTEILQGIKSKKEKDDILECIDAIPFIEITKGSWIDAGRISNELRCKGLTIPLADVLIASAALRNDCMVISYDKHFGCVKNLAVSEP
jgi:tRNA(fMet)-specific endonuclease VapC